MTIKPSDLHTIPLFRGISDERLRELLSAFKKASHPKGTVLFRPGDVPSTFVLLVKGEVAVEEEGASRFVVRPVAPIGELGSVTGIPRSTTATATSEVEILSMPVADLLGFFEKNADTGFAFYKNLLGVVSDKVRRDRRRMDDMRGNIIRTQKAMKSMREMVLAAQETELSKPIFEQLEDLIGNNRRANYRVSPTAAYAAKVRLDDGQLLNVVEVSQGYLKLDSTSDRLTKDKSYWAGVLVLPTDEILVSGSITREGADGVVVKLDTLVDEFKAKLDDYTTKLQLLDFVV
ncbi:MAG: cyclic nucleotide-binding domain-containing protein [Myxococcales bacterium]|nr:cyclic nucleotide-binding domain-containing protein [Myxococcales bacterium]